MMLLLSALAFFLLLSILILIHEWGHFAAAKRAGVVVEEFGFGLPPRAWTLFYYKGTRFSLNWIPFGGFVRLKGENSLEEVEHHAPGSFGAASLGARLMILCGGVTMNFLLAMVILTFGLSWGGWIPSYDVEDLPEAQAKGYIRYTPGVMIAGVVPGSRAELAGILPESQLVSIDGTEVKSVQEVFARQEGKTQVQYVVRSGQQKTERLLTVTLDENHRAGVVLSEPLSIEGVPRPLLTGLFLALRESWVMMVQTVFGMAHLIVSILTSLTVPQGITGIVGIAKFTHSSVQAGVSAYLHLVAFLNLSLAALNILPIPALDGGRVLFLLVEAVLRRPLNRRFEVAVNGMGFLFLISLIVLITYHDLLTLF